MPPRGQARSAPGPARPFAPPRALLPLLLLLLALRGAAATLKDPGDIDAPEPPSSGMLQQAARAALHFFNFRAGSPSALRVLDQVQEARWQADPARGYQVDLVFRTQAYHLQDRQHRLGRCSAQVLFKNQKPGPAVNVSCTPLSEKKSTLREDHLLFEQLKQLKDALNLSSIPDDYGNIDPSVRPVWALAVLGSSYLMWERTTQFLYYYPIRMSSVEQWKTSDDAIDFDYIILLHEFPTQEIVPCRVHLIWFPGKPLKVSYRCEEMQTPEASSGTEEGSAVAPKDFSHF